MKKPLLITISVMMVIHLDKLSDVDETSEYSDCRSEVSNFLIPCQVKLDVTHDILSCTNPCINSKCLNWQQPHRAGFIN